MIADVTAKCLFVAAVLLAPPAAQAADCGLEGRAALARNLVVQTAADQAGALRQQFTRAAEALAECADSEALWYVLVRAAELGADRFPVTIGSRTFATPLDAAREAASRAPESARIATVLARLDATVASARRAVALDEKWAPARLALAAALAAEGASQEADGIFADTGVMQSVPGANTVRARVLLERSKPEEAAALARRDLAGVWSKAPEFFLMSAVRRDAAETLGLALLAAHQPKQAVRPLNDAADLGSERAREALKTLRP
jgi:hypothetical protein